MSGIHAILGVAVVASNLVAGAWGGIAWLRRSPSVVFWYLLRLAQVLVVVEVVLGLLLLVLRRHGYPALQVHYLGKAATFILLYAFPLLLLADGGDGPLVAVVAPVAWALTVWGGALYLLAGALYLVQAVGLVRADRAAGGSP